MNDDETAPTATAGGSDRAMNKGFIDSRLLVTVLRSFY